MAVRTGLAFDREQRMCCSFKHMVLSACNPDKSNSTGQETVEGQTNREIKGGRSECRSMSVAGLMRRGGQQKSTSGTCSFPVELGSRRESGFKHQKEEEVADADAVCWC